MTPGDVHREFGGDPDEHPTDEDVLRSAEQLDGSSDERGHDATTNIIDG